MYQKPITAKLDPKISIGARKPNYSKSKMYMRHTLEKDKMASGSEEEIIQKKEEVEEEEGNPNRLSARQELPFLTLPSV